jgi:hypothetical protein
MSKYLYRYGSVACLMLIAAICPTGLFADSQAPSDPTRFEAADSEGVIAMRDDRNVYLKVDADVAGPITIPRLAAPLKSMRWRGREEDAGLVLNPGLDTWQIKWEQRPEGDATLILVFDAEPLLIDETKPVAASADGSFYLPAHLAKTGGEKVRYEPQPYKNTVGYWTGKEDAANWDLNIEKPGRYSVAILQGCGRGQGGSDAMLMLARSGETRARASLHFEVTETGHFQHFRWCHVGEIELAETGAFRVGVIPIQIKKAALMDIRAIHLIRLPDARR